MMPWEQRGDRFLSPLYENSKSFKTSQHLHSLESGAWWIDPNRAGAAAELSMEQLSGLFGLKRTQPKWLRVDRVLANILLV
jgi:hypothetical protein